MTYSLLAIDLDDTLLRHDLSVSRRNQEAVRLVEEAGVKVVLASGRSFGAMETYLKLLQLDREGGYLISQNGSLVIEAGSRKTVFQKCIEEGLAREILDWGYSRGLAMQNNQDDVLLATRINEYSRIDSRLTACPLVEVKDMDEFLSLPLYKIVIPGVPAQLSKLEEELDALFGSRIRHFRSKPYFLEIMPPHSDKGYALEELSARLGIPREGVVAIGDSGNDLHMIRWAGLGIAMSNARPEVKAVADWITSLDNEHDGVAEAIEKLLLQKEEESLRPGTRSGG